MSVSVCRRRTINQGAVYPSFELGRPYKRIFDMLTCFVSSGLGCLTILLGRLSIVYAARLVFWGRASYLAWSLSQVKCGVRCDRSTSVCESSPLRAISCSDQLVQEPFRATRVFRVWALHTSPVTLHLESLNATPQSLDRVQASAPYVTIGHTRVWMSLAFREGLTSPYWIQFPYSFSYQS